MANQRQPTSGDVSPLEGGLRRPEGEDLFGARLRYERERRSMTQADVAKALERVYGIKLHPSAIAKMETRDVSRPRVIRLNEATAIASLFGMSIDDMLEASDDAVKEATELAERWAGALQEAERLRNAFLAKVRSLGPALVADSAGPRKHHRKIAEALETVSEAERHILDRFDEGYEALIREFPDLLEGSKLPRGVQAELREMPDGRAYFVLETSEGHRFTSEPYRNSQEASLARRRLLDVLRSRWFLVPSEDAAAPAEGDT